MKQYDVLVVEDDISLCEALCDTLEVNGYRVISARNGTEALIKLELNHFKLVVSDVQMPVMDGYQATRYISLHYPCIKILGMSANEEAGRQMLACGASFEQLAI